MVIYLPTLSGHRGCVIMRSDGIRWNNCVSAPKTSFDESLVVSKLFIIVVVKCSDARTMEPFWRTCRAGV